MDTIEAVSYLAVALYLFHLGRRLQLEQDAEDKLTGAQPPRLTLCQEPPPEPAQGKACEPGGVRIPLERVL